MVAARPPSRTGKGPIDSNGWSRAALGARTGLDDERARAITRNVDLEGARRHLVAIERIAAGDAGAGPIAELDTTARFHGLVAPSSTIVQPSEVHTGLCDDPRACLDELFERLVR